MKIFSVSASTMLACAVGLALATSTAQAYTNFDDFNVNEGHFTGAPNSSGTSTGTAAASTADRGTAGTPKEGSGQEVLVLKYNGTSTTFRCRFLSGGGTVANNVAFTTTSGTDGRIGYYLKTTNSGWVTSINLDGTTGSIADMDGSTSLTITNDGQWHLYEWDLDSTTDWGSVPGIGGGHGGALVDSSHSIDSIYFRFTGATLPTTVPDAAIYLDFVALNPTGSIDDIFGQFPCLNTSPVAVGGPISTNSNQVLVTGAAATATTLTVYQNTGTAGAMVPIGSKSSGVVAGNNLVTVSGLVKAAQVTATQTIAGQESCVPPSGIVVGGGANPSVRLALTIRETSSTGPAGAPGDTASTALHFFGASTVQGGAPINAQIIYPSNTWQTVTFKRGTEDITNSANVNGVVVGNAGYAANDVVALQVFAFRTWNGVTIYSSVAAQSPDVTSNDVFSVNWTWDAVAGAQGYRLLRNLNSAGYGEYLDVAAVNNYSDSNTVWTAGSTVTPTTTPTTRSIQWNPSVGNPDNIATPWGILESLNFAISDLDNTGPFDLYVDNIQNGTNVFQTFENAVAGTTNYAFRAPSFSGTTSGSILSSPDLAVVSNSAADTGTKSLHLRFQWNGTNVTRWLRLSTTGQALPLEYPINPQVDMNEPISLRLLLLPVGSSPTPPAQPSISAASSAGNIVLSWPGAHNLEAASAVTGPYAIVPNITTNVPNPSPSPYSTNTLRPGMFYRLNN